MFDFVSTFKDPGIQINLLMSVALAVIILSLRVISVRTIQGWKIHSPDLRRSWLNQARNVSLGLFGIGLAIIWAEELRNVALSLAALAVAIVIATKELLLCLMGSFVRASTGAFRMGDRIEVAGFRGDVIDQNLFGTTILEIGPGHSGHLYTGRRLSIPNSLFISSPIVNEAFTGKLCMHTFKFSCRREDDWRAWEAEFLKAANEECEKYVQETQRLMNKLSRDKIIEAPSAEPRLLLDFSEFDRVDFHLRIPCPPSIKGKIEQDIIRNFLNRTNAGVQEASPRQ